MSGAGAIAAASFREVERLARQGRVPGHRGHDIGKWTGEDGRIDIACDDCAVLLATTGGSDVAQ